jgi:hypothetical protein
MAPKGGSFFASAPRVGAWLAGLRNEATRAATSRPREALRAPAVNQDSLVAHPARWVAAVSNAHQWTPQSHLEA